MSNTARMVALGGAMLVGAGCGGGGADPDDRSIKVGAIFDFTGPTADVGTDYGDGVRGFADWINSGGGIEGRPIDLIYQDYGYQVDRAEQLYTQFVGEGAVIFMGWGTGDTEALRLLHRRGRDPVQLRVALASPRRPGGGSLQLPAGDDLQRPVPHRPRLGRRETTAAGRPSSR